MASKFDKNSQQHPGRYIGVLKEEAVVNTAGNGLDVTQGGEFSLDLKSNGGLVIESTELAVDLAASSITGLLNVGDGGTGQSTAQAAIDALTQVSGASAGEALIKDGSGNATWAAQTNTTYTAGDGLNLSGTTFSTDIKANSGITIDSTELSMDLGASSITGTLAVGDGGTGASSLTSDAILTGTGTNPITAESSLTYTNSSGIGGTSTLTIGETNSGTRRIATPPKASSQNGDLLALSIGNCGAGTNMRGGLMEFYSGGATGNMTAGHYMFYGAPMRNPAGGSQTSQVVEQMFLFRENAGVADATHLRLFSPSDSRNYLDVIIQDPGLTTITTVDTTGPSGIGADLKLLADGALILQSTGASKDITLDSAEDIKIDADGGNIDFKNNTAHFAKLTNLLNGRGQLDLYGGSCGNQSCGAQIDFYEDTGAGSNHITLKGAWSGAGLGSDKTISLPNATGTVALTSDIPGDIVNTKQIMQSRDGYASIFALFYGLKWYNASGGTQSWGVGSVPNLDTYTAQQKGFVYTRGPLVTAVSNMKIYKVYMNFFWYSKQPGVCNSARNMEFSFHKATHANNSQAEHTLSSAIVATNLNAAYACDTQYNLVFELAAGSGFTLNAGDSLHMFMRCPSYNSSTIIFGQIVGQIYVEYKYV